MGSAVGTFQNLVGINKAPRGTDSQSLGSNTYQIANLYAAMGVTNVRMLDSLFDVCEVFTDDTITNADTSATLTNCVNAQGTHSIWSANSGGSNINNTSKYNFTTVNANLEALYNSTADMYIRLGENNNGPNDTTDFTNYATAAINLYKHVSGTSGGFGASPTHTVSPGYIELTNEPDGGFWMGTKSNYYSLYNTLYDAVDAIAPSNVKIGGPAFTTTFEEHLSNTNNVASSFVSSVTTSRLDFMSAHVYGDCDPSELSDASTHLQFLRNYMNSNGLAAKPLIISEWNIGLDCSSESPFHSQRAQSYNASILSIMQDPTLNIERAHFYGGLGQMSFFTVDPSDVGVVTVYPGAWALKAHSYLIGGDLLSLESCDSNEVCTTGLGMTSSPIQAVSVKDGAELKVVLSNDTSSNARVTLQVNHWAGSSSPTLLETQFPTASVTVDAPLSSSVYVVDTNAISSLLENSLTMTTLTANISSDVLEGVVDVPAHSVVYVNGY